MPVRKLNPEGGGHETVRQQGCWAPKGVNWKIPRQLEKETSVSEDVGSRGEVDCEISRRLNRGTKHFFYKGVETSP